MKLRILASVIAATAIGAVVWSNSRSPPPVIATVLSFRVGQEFQDVVKASTYPVVKRSNIPTHAYLQSGETFVTEPAVILHFNDPAHAFTLPPTKFALVGYTHNIVETVATSPNLDKLPFDQVVVILEDLQNQFKAGGWEPWEINGSKWFDFSPEGKKRLYARMFEPGYSEEATLRVPDKYSMTFRLKCTDGCWDQTPPYLFLIDVGVSKDIYQDIPHKKKPATPSQASTGFPSPPS